MSHTQESLPVGAVQPRTLKEHAHLRQKQRAEMVDEIAQIAARFHELLPRDQAESIGAVYARYSSRYQSSIGDQVRACFEEAVRRKIFVPAENVFFDQATRGFKQGRAGLTALQAAIEAKAFKVLLVLTTNRLHRKTYRALQLVEEELVERGLRAIFVKSGIDTADAERWRLLMNFNAMVDEFVVSIYAANIRAAHEGLFDRRLVFGTISFGYIGAPIPGEFTKQKKPRCRLIVDQEASRWVLQIFGWFVVDRLTINEIVRRLNGDPRVPLSPRCMSGGWSHLAVRLLLANARYRGYWEYGKTQTIWHSKKDYAKQEPREAPLRDAQIEELRIVPDALWHAPQLRLEESVVTAAGRRPLDGNRKTRPRLLNGLFFCPTHDRPLTVGGAYGVYMACPECQVLPADQRALFSQLPRVLALRLTCDALAERLRDDTELVQVVIAACRAEAERLQNPDPAELKALHRKREVLDKQISFILRNGGETEHEQREAEAVLKEQRRQRNEVQLAISLREEARDRVVTVPTADEVRRLARSTGHRLGIGCGQGARS